MGVVRWLPPGWEHGTQIAGTGLKRLVPPVGGKSISRELIKRVTGGGRRGYPPCHLEFMALLAAVAPGEESETTYSPEAIQKLADEVRRCMNRNRRPNHKPTTNYLIMKALKPKS